MSDAEMTNLLLRDLASRISDLNKKLKVKVTQGQFDALISMGFNTGFANKFFLRALALTNEGKMQEAAAVINSGPKTSKGQVMGGLVRRRREESIQYLA
jgi:lysozyme